MNKSIVMISLLLLAAGSSGCVSTSKYKKLESDKAALQAKMDALANESNRLAQESARLADEKAALEKQNADKTAEYDSVINQLSHEVQRGELQVKQYQNMLKVDLAEQIFFASGSANIKSGGKTVLKKVGTALSGYKDKIIRVVGHTDNVPLGKDYQAIFPTNWELSVLRATNVVRFLQDECGLEPERLIASGRGEYSPIAPNDSPENRKKNRRIEIMLLDKSVVDTMTKN